MNLNTECTRALRRLARALDFDVSRHLREMFGTPGDVKIEVVRPRVRGLGFAPIDGQVTAYDFEQLPSVQVKITVERGPRFEELRACMDDVRPFRLDQFRLSGYWLACSVDAGEFLATFRFEQVEP